MKPDHRDFDVTQRVLRSMSGDDLINLHDKVFRKSYDHEKNPSKSHIMGKLTRKFDNYAHLYSNLSEEAPVNSVGSGAVAGIGVGPDGEPGFSKKDMTKTKKRKSFSQFVNGNK